MIGKNMRFSILLLSFMIIIGCSRKENNESAVEKIENEVQTIDTDNSEILEIEADTKVEPESLEVIDSETSIEASSEEIAEVRTLINSYDHENGKFPPIEDRDLIEKVFKSPLSRTIEFSLLANDESLVLLENYIEVYKFPEDLYTNELIVSVTGKEAEILHTYGLEQIYEIKSNRNLYFVILDDFDEYEGTSGLWIIDGEKGFIKKLLKTSHDIVFSDNGHLLIHKDYEHYREIYSNNSSNPILANLKVYSVEKEEYIFYINTSNYYKPPQNMYYDVEPHFNGNQLIVDISEDRVPRAQLTVDLFTEKVETIVY